MPAFSWNTPAASNQVIGANVSDDCLAAINAVVVANSGGVNAKWEVATYQSVSPRYVILRRKSGAAGRIVIFGQQGSTANAAATYSTPSANSLYVGYSKTSTSNTIDTSWLTGAPFSATDYMPGLRAMLLAAATWRVNYTEFTDGIYFAFSEVSNGIYIFGAGELAQDTAGAAISAVQGCGQTGLANWATTTAGAGSFVPANVGSDTHNNTDSGLLVRTGGANRLAYRGFVLGTGVAAKLVDTAGGIANFFPIPLVNSNINGTLTVLGKMRQVGFGPLADRETLRTNGTINAYGHQSTNSGSPTQPGIWFPDIEI